MRTQSQRKWTTACASSSGCLIAKLLIASSLLPFCLIGCTRPSRTESSVDPASARMPDTPRSAPVPLLSHGVETGSELIGEPQGRTPMRHGNGMSPGGHEAMEQGMTPPPTRQDGASGQRNAAGQQYTCPMHPEIVQAAPGKCPKCGMDLVPRKEQGKRKGNGP